MDFTMSFLFKEIKTLRVVERQFQYNMEAVAGKLVEIDPTTPCLLLAHVPNKKWSYDVNVLEKLEASEAVKRINPLPQKSDKPEVFYAVIIESDYNTYMTDYAFRELPSKTKEPKPEDIIKANPKPKIINTGDAKTNIGSVPSQIGKFDYTPSLDRTAEKTIYKFTPGSQRYG